MVQRIERLSQELDELKQDTKGSRVPGPNRLCLSVLDCTRTDLCRVNNKHFQCTRLCSKILFKNSYMILLKSRKINKIQKVMIIISL